MNKKQEHLLGYCAPDCSFCATEKVLACPICNKRDRRRPSGGLCDACWRRFINGRLCMSSKAFWDKCDLGPFAREATRAFEEPDD